MKVAILTNEYPPGPHGGIGSFSSDLAEGLAVGGCDVDVIVAELNAKRSRRIAQCTPEGTSPRVWRVAYSSPAWLRWRPGALWQRWLLRRDLSRLRFQVLECMDNAGLLPFGGVRGAATVVRLHGASFFYDGELGSVTTDAFTHTLEKRTLAAADRLVAVSRFIGERECPDRRIDRVIYNAIDTDTWKPDPAVPVEEGLIVFANAIHPRKGIGELCEAMNVVAERHAHARLVIIGRVVSGDDAFKHVLLDRVRPEFRSRVEFTGGLPRAEVRQWIQRAHLCCYPSKLESFGLAPVEAMALGKPVIYSMAGPGPEVIEDGISGLLCDPASPADIATKICAVLENRELANSLAINGRRRVVERFDRKRWIEQNLEFYEECAR